MSGPNSIFKLFVKAVTSRTLKKLHGDCVKNNPLYLIKCRWAVK